MDIDTAPKKPGRPPRDPREWKAAFLEAYKECGSACLSAERAGVNERTVRKYRLSHPKFALRVKRARRYFREAMEYELVKQARGESKGSFLAAVARIKASHRKMLEKYSEKVADARVMNFTINQSFGSPPEAAQIMERLMGRLAPVEIQAMQALPAGDIVEGELVASPERSDSEEREENEP